MNSLQNALRPDLATIPAFYKNYVELVKDFSLLDALRHSSQQCYALLLTIPEQLGEYRYAEGKWSIKELLCHVHDAERIFAYRALRFARHDKTNLPGFDENAYVPHSNAHTRSVKQIAEEGQRLRVTTIDMFSSFSPEMLRQTGAANNTEISVLNLGYIIAGHETHHCRILKERYLKS
jgi:hypothetical protein